MKIAEIFVKHKVEVFGGDTWVILFCDNLKAHENDQVQNSFEYSKMILYDLHKNITKAVQTIDSGYEKSLRCKIGHVLDIFLMSEETLSKQEGTMTSAYLEF